ncbi:MAG: BF3164 family lipoprotein [Bacteroidota bacterium]
MFHKNNCFLLSLLLLGVLVSGCGNSADPEMVDEGAAQFSREDFPQNQEITLTPFPAELNENFPDMRVYEDYIFMLGHYGNYALKVYSRADSAWLGDLVPRGTGPGESIGFASFFPGTEEGVYIGYDITVGQFLKVDLNAWQQNPEKYVAEVMFRVDGNLQNLYGITSAPTYDGYAGLSFNLDDARIYIFDSTNQVSQRIGQLPPVPADWPQERDEDFPVSLRARAHEGAVLAHPSEPWLVYLGSKKDEIRIYKDTTEVKHLIGPEQYPFSLTLGKSGERFIPAPSADTHFTYTKGLTVTEEYLILPWSGTPYADRFVQIQEILVLSWDGEPVTRITWENNITTLGVWATDGKLEIFGVDAATGKMMTGTAVLP